MGGGIGAASLAELPYWDELLAAGTAWSGPLTGGAGPASPIIGGICAGGPAGLSVLLLVAFPSTVHAVLLFKSQRSSSY